MHRALGRGWFLIGLVRGLWAGQFALGEEALERALRHARVAGDRRQEADIVGRLGFAAWSGPMPVPKAVERCNELLVGAGDDTFVTAGGRRWLASLIAREGRYDEARSLVAEAVAAYEELGSSLNATTASAFGYGDVEWFAGDLAAAERALRRGFRELERLGELGYRASVAALESRVLHRLGRARGGGASSPRSWRRPRPRTTSGRKSCSASRARASSPTRARIGDAEAICRDALARVERTDLLDLHGDTLLDLGHVLRAGGREEESKECAEQALFLYERRRTSSRPSWARAFLEAGVTPV